MNKHDKRNACRRFNYIFVFSVLVLMMFNFLQPVKKYSELENRYLQTFPEFSVKSILNGQYMADVESYVNDHFVSRNFFVTFKSKLEYLMGKKENNGVYVCDDGYLIEKPSNLDEDLVNKNMEAIKALNNTNRYNVSVTVIPPAYEILQDKLPDNTYRDIIPRLNQMMTEAFDGTDISFRESSDLLKKHKDDYLYYRTDHHLTSHGSYVVYHDLADMLGYEPLGDEDFKISDVTREFMGTTYSKALRKTEPDVVTEYKPLETARFKVRFPYEGTEADSMYFPVHLNAKDKYSYFLDGNHALTVVESPNKNGKHLAVFKDSYAHALVPFIANHYETIHMIDLRYYNDDFIQYLSDNGIGDVLFLYSTMSFMSDETIQKVTSFSQNSPALIQKFGKVAATKPVADTYFTNTAFIGDSLTDGFRMHANLPDATFLCGTSMTIDRLNEREAPGGGNIMERIKQGGFDKVYIMLGINENLVDSARDGFIARYASLVDTVKQSSPDAVVYVQSILPVSAQRDQNGPLHNAVIRRYNEALLAMAIEKQVYYIDVDRIMTDEHGNLPDGASSDGAHPFKEYYLSWLEYLKRHTVNADEAKYAAQVAAADAAIESDYDVQGIADEILNTVTFSDSLSGINRRILYSNYGLDESYIANAAGYAGSGATAEEIAVFEAKDIAYAEELENMAEAYIERKKDSFRSYIPEEMPKLNRPFVFREGKVVVMCIADDYGAIEEQIREKMKS